MTFAAARILGQLRVMDEGLGQIGKNREGARWECRGGGDGMGVWANDMVLCTQWSSDVIKAVIRRVVSALSLMTNAMRWN